MLQSCHLITGTTVLGAFDPILALADVCEAHGLWLHVDAAWGGGALVSRRHRHLLSGIERYLIFMELGKSGKRDPITQGVKGAAWFLCDKQYLLYSSQFCWIVNC